MACIVEEMVNDLEARAKTLDPVRMKIMTDLAMQLKEVIPEKETSLVDEKTSRISTAEFVREYLIDTRDIRHSASNEAKRVFKEKLKEVSDRQNIPAQSILDQYANKGYVTPKLKTEIADAARMTMDAMGGQPEFKGQFDVNYSQGVQVDGIDTEKYKDYYAAMNKLVLDVLGTEVKTSEYLAFSKATLENLTIVAGKYRDGVVTVSTTPNQDALEAEMQEELEAWYTTKSPYAKEYQGLDEDAMTKKLKSDPTMRKIAKQKVGMAAQAMTEFAKVNGTHTLAHELVHAGSVEYMKSNPTSEKTKRIEELYQEALENKDDILGSMKHKSEYWMINKEEFVAEALSNPYLVHALQNLRTEKRRRLTPTLFRDMVDALMSMVGVKKSDNVYEYVLDGYVAMVESVAKPAAMNEVLDTVRNYKMVAEQDANALSPDRKGKC